MRKSQVQKSRRTCPRCPDCMVFPPKDSLSFSVWSMVHTLEDAFLVLSGCPYAEMGDFKTDEEFPFPGFGVFIVCPGIICKKKMWLCGCVHFSEKADFHQILKVICDHKTTESSTQKYFYFGKCFYDLFLLPMTIFCRVYS